MAYLEPTKGTELPLVVLSKPRTVFGRLPECDVIIPRREVSRLHAALVQEGNRYFLEDLGSRNGTFLNGQPVVARVALQDGDEVSIARVVWFTFREGSPEETTTAAEEGAPKIVYTIDSKSSALLLQARPEAKLAAILEILNSLGASINLTDTLNRIVDCLPRIFPQTDVALILLCGDTPEDVRPVAVYTRNQRQVARRTYSQTVVRRVIERKESILSTDVRGESSFDISQSIADLHIRSLMCVPLVSSQNEVLGVVELHTENPRQRFTHEDLEVLTAVARVASVAVENASLHESILAKQRMERELELAKEVQSSLLPDQPPRIPGIVLSSYYEPSRVVGGDFFDYLRLPDNRLAIVVGDVSGKGMPAALLMVRAITELRNVASATANLTEIIGEVNRSLCARSLADRFLTSVILALDPASGAVQMVNAAHPPPVYRSASGETCLLGVDRNGLPLAVQPDANYPITEHSMEPGSLIVLYTDGLTDAAGPAGGMVGIEGVLDFVRSAPSTEPEQVCNHVLRRLRSYVRGTPPFDDTCVVAVKWEPPG